MRFLVFWVVKASESDSSKNSSKNDVSNSESLVTEGEDDNHVVETASHLRTTSSSEAVTDDSSTFDALRKTVMNTKHDLAAAADFATEKVRRIIRKNMTKEKEIDHSQSTAVSDDAPQSTEQGAAIESLVGEELVNEIQLDNNLAMHILQEAAKRQQNTHWKERFKNIFRKNTLSGDFSPELQIWIGLLKKAFIATFFLGSFGEHDKARAAFIKANVATKYASPMAASRKLMDYALRTRIRNGFKFAVPCTAFVGLCGAVSILLSVYEDTEKVWHHGVGGMYAGIHNRFMLGPRAWLIGGVVGGGLGLAGGSLALTLRNNFGGIPLREYQYYRHIQLVMEDLYQNGELPAPPGEFELYHKMPLIY